MIKHLRETHMSYFSHLLFAFVAGVILLQAGIASIIHSIFPWLLVGYSERKTIALARLANQRKNARKKY